MSVTRRVLELLTPYSLRALSMERWGPDADGGYVVPSAIMQKTTLLVTGGVADNVHFEADAARRVPQLRMRLFDHTIDSLPSNTPASAEWFKTGLASQETANFTTLEKACGVISAHDVLVIKLDIEGYEWEVLRSAGDGLLSTTAVLIVEYHFLERRERWKEFVSVLERLNVHFLPVHVHGNNHSIIAHINRFGVDVPDVLEVTYVNRSWITPSPWASDAPTSLDRPNQDGVKDYTFNYWSNLTGKYWHRLWQRFIRR